MTAPTASRRAIFRDLDADYGQRNGYACIAGKDRNNPDPKHFVQQFFKWPEQRSDAATYVRELVQAGLCVWKPTSLCVGKSRTHTHPSNIVSFEVDQELSDEAWELLDCLDATLITSGTEGHFHVKVQIDQDLSHDDLVQVTEHLARACGISGSADSGGKWKPNDLLRVVSTYNTKHDPPVEVAIMRPGKGATIEDLRAILATYDAPQRKSFGNGDIEPEAIAWDAVPPSVKHQYGEIGLNDDRSDGIWQFWLKCKKRGMPIGRAFYASTELDPEGYISDRYPNKKSIAAQIRKVYETEPPKSQSTPSDQEGGNKETGGMTVTNDDNTDGLVQPSDGFRLLRRGSSVKIKKLQWVIPHRMLFGALNLLAGREGIGKSSVVYGWVAGVTNGKLEGCLFGKQRYVLVRASEEAWDFSIAPRLIAAGADMDYVLFLESKDPDIRDLTLPDDLEMLRELVRANDIALVIFDPIISVLDDDLDTDKGKNLRRALEPINALAQEAKCAVLGIAHFNKRGEGDVGTLLSGHLAWSQVARATIAMVRDHDRENAFYLLNGKVNNAAEQPVLSGHTEGRLVETEDGDETETSVVVWDGEADISAGQLLGLGKDKRSPREEWLHTTIIRGGESGVPAKEVLALGEARGYGAASIRATAKKLQLESHRDGFGKGSSVWWRYPEPSLTAEIDLR